MASLKSQSNCAGAKWQFASSFCAGICLPYRGSLEPGESSRKRAVTVPAVQTGIVLAVERKSLMPEAYDDLMTADEACEALKIGKNTLYALLSAKTLKADRNGRVWRIPKRAVVEYILSQSHLG